MEEGRREEIEEDRRETGEGREGGRREKGDGRRGEKCGQVHLFLFFCSVKATLSTLAAGVAVSACLFTCTLYFLRVEM